MAVLTEEEYISTAKEVSYLAACAVNGEKPDKERVAQMNPDHLFYVAKRHQLAAVTAIALESAGVKIAEFTQAKGKAIRKNAALDIDRAALAERLEAEQIWYVPLKGAVLADYYPQFGMREMSDNDILIDAGRAGDVKEIMKSIGFAVEQFGKGIHDEYYKQPVSHFEMHRALFFSYDDQLYEYYKDVASRLKQEDGTSARFFSNEDFYIYLIAHEYKHFSGAGTGLRSLLDIYVFWRKFGEELDKSYLEKEFERLGIADFEKKNRSLALRLFSGEELSEQEEELLRYFVLSGVFGNTQNQIAKRGRWRYVLENIFVPYRRMVTEYPFLRRLPFLLPFCWISWLKRQLVKNRKRIFLKLRVIFNLRKKKK